MLLNGWLNLGRVLISILVALYGMCLVRNLVKGKRIIFQKRWTDGRSVNGNCGSSLTSRCVGSGGRGVTSGRRLCHDRRAGSSTLEIGGDGCLTAFIWMLAAKEVREEWRRIVSGY